KIAGAPIGSPQFLGSKEESMACSLRRYGVTDSGSSQPTLFLTAYNITCISPPSSLMFINKPQDG
ncbi:MAG: hypothetical protein P8X79_19310, partial [Reinekea sp.]